MILWRISRHRDLSGAGGLRAPGRWHDAGHPIVYLAETPAAALLEVCVHTSANDVPPDFTLLRIEGPALRIRSIQPKDLPENWRGHPEATRVIGTAWLTKAETALLRVPSALVPETSNYLFNPAHKAAAKFRIAETSLRCAPEEVTPAPASSRRLYRNPAIAENARQRSFEVPCPFPAKLFA